MSLQFQAQFGNISLDISAGGMLISNLALQNVEFQRSYNWDILLPDVSSASLGTIAGVEVSPFVQGISFGQYSMDDVAPIQHGSLKTHSAGVLSIREVSVDFICPAFSVVFDYFEAWRSLIYDSTNLCYFIKANYANGGIGGRPCIVSFYDTTSSMVYQWTLVNIFPKTFPNFKLNYEQQEVMKFTVEFSVDFIQPNNAPLQ